MRYPTEPEMLIAFGAFSAGLLVMLSFFATTTARGIIVFMLALACGLVVILPTLRS